MNTSSKLLQLPGELRNIIYHHVFTNLHSNIYRCEPGRFFIRNINTDGGSISIRRECEINQLQYVCHQLRYETRALALRFNDLYFENYADASHFLRGYPKSRVKWLKTIHILDGGLSTIDHAVDGLQEVKELCAAHSHMLVRAHQQRSRVNSHLFWAHMILLQFLQRGHVHLLYRLIPDAEYRDNLIDVSFYEDYGMTTNRRASASSLPENFRICPQDEEFDEGLVRKAVEESEYLLHIVNQGLKGDVKHWVKVMKEMYEEGC